MGISGLDREISQEFQKILNKQGIKFKLNSKVSSIKNKNNSVLVTFTDIKLQKAKLSKPIKL